MAKPDPILAFQEPVRDDIRALLRGNLTTNLTLLGYTIPADTILSDLFSPDDQAVLRRASELGMSHMHDPIVETEIDCHKFFIILHGCNSATPGQLRLGAGESATHTFVRDIADVVLSWRRMYQTFCIFNQQGHLKFRPSTIAYFLPWLTRMVRPAWDKLPDRDPDKIALMRMQAKPSAIIGLSREQRQYLIALDDAFTRFELLRQARNHPQRGAVHGVFPEVEAHGQLATICKDCPFLRDGRFHVSGYLAVGRDPDAYLGEQHATRTR